jgi:glycosyltransferase involved in cell wall biosynthesis
LPAEIIVIDQSSDNLTESAIAGCEMQGAPVIYVRQERRGLSASRNTAAARATQPIIAFTDDDCVPHRQWVATIDAVLAAPSQIDVVTGRVLPLGAAAPGLFAVSLRESTARVEFHGKTLPWHAGSGGNAAMRRRWFERVAGCDERLGAGSPGRAAEDMDIFYRLLCAGACIQYNPDVIVYHERQTRAQRLASCWGYGYGMGAFCGLWLRRRDLYALRMLGCWLSLQGRELAGGILHRRGWLHVYQRGLRLCGAVRGLLYGLSA